MDTHSPQLRSFNMSRIKRRDTKPELLVRSALHRLGFRYRLDVAELAGRPDIVMPKHRLAVFVNGCFWHSHDCRRGNVRPKSNSLYWANKRERTVQRDVVNGRELAKAGWRVVKIWECEIDSAATDGKLHELVQIKLSSQVNC
jgi:DNA mismatch endonuclease, patch repair protein